LKRQGIDPRVKEELTQWQRSIRDVPSLHEKTAWRGNLKHLLPSPRKLNRKKGHRSAPYTKMPQMMTGLRSDPGNAARCTEVGILTLSRSQEIRLMEWTELDFEAKTWMVPAEKMKIKGDLEPKPNFRREVREFCLSHRVGDDAEPSYWVSGNTARFSVIRHRAGARPS
jgi:hypothetical protein